MYRRMFFEETLLFQVVSALEELHSLKVERATNIQPENTMSEMLKEMALVEKKQIVSVSDTLTRFKHEVEYAQREPTPNEELEAVDKVMLTYYGPNLHILPGERPRLLENMLRDGENKTNRAWATFSKLADDIRVKLLAIKYLLDRAPHAGNHGEKNRRIAEVGELMVTVIQEMAKVKGAEEYDSYRTRYTSGSWDYVQALTDLHHKTQNAEKLEAQLIEITADNQKMRAELDRLYELVSQQDEKENDIHSITHPPVRDGSEFGPIKPIETEDEIPF